MNIKIIDQIQKGADKAVICEIPSSLAKHLDIDTNGEVDPKNMIKLLRRAYIQCAIEERGITSNNTIKRSISSQIPNHDRQELFDLIFNHHRAVDVESSTINTDIVTGGKDDTNVSTISAGDGL